MAFDWPQRVQDETNPTQKRQMKLAIVNRLRARLTTWHNAKSHAIMAAGGTESDVSVWRESVWRPRRDRVEEFRATIEDPIVSALQTMGETDTLDDALYSALAETVDAIDPDDPGDD